MTQAKTFPAFAWQPFTQATGRRRISLTGIVRSNNRSTLTFVVSGRLEERPVDIGDVVEKGQSLARLDHAGYANQVGVARAARAQARAQHDQLVRDVERSKKLLAAKAIGTEELERVRSGLDGAAASLALSGAQLAEAQRQLKESRLRAPFDGVVSEVFAEPGEFIGPGAPVLALSGTRELEVEVEVPESFVAPLEKNAEVEVSFPLAGIPNVTGVVQSVSEAARAQGRLFPVVVRLPERDDLRAGLTAKTLLSVSRSSALSVPVEAVLDPSGTAPFVYVIRDGVLSRVEIEPLDIEGERVLIDAPLSEGDAVAVAGHVHLSEGDAVRVAR